MNPHFLNKRLVHLLVIGALVPFALLMLSCWIVSADWLGYFIRGQLAYAIVVLSFLGGTHWGMALSMKELSRDQTRNALLWGALSPAIAWSSTLLSGFGFALLMAGFIGAYQIDKRLFARYGLPDWFLPLRLKLTIAVVVILMLTVAAANVRG